MFRGVHNKLLIERNSERRSIRSRFPDQTLVRAVSPVPRAVATNRADGPTYSQPAMCYIRASGDGTKQYFTAPWEPGCLRNSLSQGLADGDDVAVYRGDQAFGRPISGECRDPLLPHQSL